MNENNGVDFLVGKTAIRLFPIKEELVKSSLLIKQKPRKAGVLETTFGSFVVTDFRISGISDLYLMIVKKTKKTKSLKKHWLQQCDY